MTILDSVTLNLLPGVGPRRAAELRRREPLAEALARPDDHADLLPAEALDELRSGRARRRAEAELKEAARQGLRVVGLDEAEYPAWLKQIYDAPPVLYARGDLVADEGARSVAVVGARAASAAGGALARRMARELAAAGATIVSGLARGIDSEAHRGALEAGGRTVAVLGSGLDRLYPPENAALAAQIARRGAVVSEY